MMVNFIESVCQALSEKKSLVVGFSLVCSLGFCQDAPTSSSSNLAEPQLRSKVDALIHREMNERRIPGLQLAVIHRGKIDLLNSYGTVNLQYAIPVTNQSLFSINSCTKAFTGVAVMQLVEANKVKLSAPISLYLDGLPASWQPITVRQLLTHVSGLPDIVHVLDSLPLGLGMDEKTAWAKTESMPMEFSTGEQFSYNQTNYALLGRIITKYNQKPFAQVFNEQQWKVASMSNTNFGDSRDVVSNKTQSYRYVREIDGQALSEPKLTNAYEEFPPFRRTASGMNSTAEDIAHWIIALQQGKLFKAKSTLDTLWTSGRYKNGSPTQWALGWVTKPRLKHKAVIATGGGRSALFVYPDDDLSIIILTNLAGAYPEEFIDELAGCYNPAIAAADPITTLHIQLRQRGFNHAQSVLNELKKKDAKFQLSEADLNDWAYRILSRGQTRNALELFKLNALLYPASWNTYDSYGEALLKDNQKIEAVEMYKKSIILNPNNLNGKRILEKLLK